MITEFFSGEIITKSLLMKLPALDSVVFDSGKVVKYITKILT
jgi:hypothetical protein